MTETETVVLPLPDIGATYRLGEALGRSLLPGSVVLLEGNLGSGKTTLVQGIGQGLGITEPIVSPTFTLVNEYLEGRIPLYHLDLYRLQHEEVTALHPETYWDGLDFPLGIVAIEWAGQLQHRPTNYLQVCLTVETEDTRRACLTFLGEQIELSLLTEAVAGSRGVASRSPS